MPVVAIAPVEVAVLVAAVYLAGVGENISVLAAAIAASMAPSVSLIGEEGVVVVVAGGVVDAVVVAVSAGVDVVAAESVTRTCGGFTGAGAEVLVVSVEVELSSVVVAEAGVVVAVVSEVDVESSLEVVAADGEVPVGAVLEPSLVAVLAVSF